MRMNFDPSHLIWMGRIERDPRRPNLVLTEVGVGYQLAAESDDPLYLAHPTLWPQGKGDRAP